MSVFLHNEACPKCRANGHDARGDNLGVYSDNHKWCWRCGYYEAGDIVTDYYAKKKSNLDTNLDYPDKVPFSNEVLDYLSNFNLTNEEIHANLVGNEDGYAFFDSNFFLIRRLHKKPKVIVKGNVVGNEPIFISKNPSQTIVLVEDIISAIKVSRVIDSCALLKTAIHDTLLVRMCSRYENCVLWLDPDMYEHMTKKLAPKLKPYFKSVKIVMSRKDPKYYSTSEIASIIKGGN